MTWYVMHGSADYGNGKPCTEPPGLCEFDEGTWYTISEDPNKAGWCSDGGCPGYGLTYERAKYICDVLNAYEREKPKRSP